MERKENQRIISYILSTSKDSLTHLAYTLGQVTGDSFAIENNRMKISKAHGDGGIDFYELGIGIALITINCSFYENYLFRRDVADVVEHHCLLFNFSDKAVTFKSDTRIAKGHNIPKLNIFTHSDNYLEINVPGGSRINLVLLQCTSAWLLANVGLSPETFKKNIGFASLQRSFLRICLPELGKAVRTSMVKLLEEKKGVQKLAKNEDFERLYHFKNSIGERLNEELPSLEDAARACLMSVSKFARLFKKTFKTSYANFFWNLRLVRACELLEDGLQVGEVAMRCGYSTNAAFTKAFKEKYRVPPQQYQRSVLVSHNK